MLCRRFLALRLVENFGITNQHLVSANNKSLLMHPRHRSRLSRARACANASGRPEKPALTADSSMFAGKNAALSPALANMARRAAEVLAKISSIKPLPEFSRNYLYSCSKSMPLSSGLFKLPSPIAKIPPVPCPPPSRRRAYAHNLRGFPRRPVPRRSPAWPLLCSSTGFHPWRHTAWPPQPIPPRTRLRS